MKYPISLTALLFLAFAAPLQAQRATDIVQSILLRNTTLKAQADEADANKLSNLTGLTLADPEVEFSYFWGSPMNIGKRTDFSVTQRLDYATLFGLKKKLANSKNEVIELQLQLSRLALEGEVRQLLIELTYLNKQQVQLADRIATAQRLADKYSKAVKQGDATSIERDKAQLSLTSLQVEQEELTIAQQKVKAQLQALNGGEAIAYPMTEYETITPLAAISQKTLTSELLTSQGKALEQETQQARAAGMPELTAGYASELTADEKFRGISIGLSIPLWSNRGNVKKSRAMETAHKSQAEDALFQIAQQQQAVKTDMERHYALSERLRKTLAQTSTLTLLQRSLELGEISLLDYLQECTLLYDLQDKALQAEHEYQQAHSTWQLISGE